MLIVDNPGTLAKYRPLLVDRQANQVRPGNQSRKGKGEAQGEQALHSAHKDIAVLSQPLIEE